MAAVADYGLSLELQLQALLCKPANFGASPILRQDNVATIVRAKFGIQAITFNGKECAGPIPGVLFRPGGGRGAAKGPCYRA
jgi:hypothetical protein